MMTTLRRIVLFFAIMTGISHALKAQENPSAKDLRYGSYLGVSALLDFARIRDFGVSPHTYQGLLLGGMGELSFENPRWDVSFQGGVAQGNPELSKVAIFNSSALCFFYSGQVLRRVWQKAEGSWDLKAGLIAGGYSNERRTPAFLNASTVWESLNTLQAGAKLSWRIGFQQRAGKFLFLRKNEGRRFLKFSTQLNLPILHSAWRPGYAYVDDFTDGDNTVFENNTLRFGGWRAQWRTEASYYLLNGNNVRIGYVWDAQRSPGELNRLDFTHHILQTALMIRLN
jgi:hypothetical protein